MSVPKKMSDHFRNIAPVYREIRTTDEAPVRFIAEALAGRKAIRAADIGCGAGRYDRLLFAHLSGLHLLCVDVNPDMLGQLCDLLAAGGIGDFETRVAGVEDLELADSSLDAVFTFNAIHHFDFPAFLAKAGRAIRSDGRIFVYTRTPEQNAGSVWGRFFPGFAEKETRLYRLDEMTEAVCEAAELRLLETKTFRYRRRAPVERLLLQARSRHYSTFALYSDEEFAAALAAFEDNVRRRYDDPQAIEWQDQNLMLMIGR